MAKLVKPYKIGLQSLDFRYESSDHTTSALPIVGIRNDWSPENRSFCAYSLADLTKTLEAGTLKLWAHFKKSTGGGFVEVRNKSTIPEVKDFVTLEIMKMHPGKDALGTVVPKRIFFDDTGHSIFRGKHSSVPLTLQNVALQKIGVGVYDINWRWEFRIPMPGHTEEKPRWSAWIPMRITKHRVCVLLDAPTFPWSTHMVPNFKLDPPYPSPVWREALYWACRWAQGASTKSEAAKRIADGLFESGRFEYNPNSSYHKHSAVVAAAALGDGSAIGEKTLLHNFYLSQVLERLQGGNGFGPKINCLDCSMIVSSLANLLGCNLRMGKLQNTPSTDYADPEIANDNRFEIQPLKALGFENTSSSMKPLLSDGKHYFSYHSVAWAAAEGVDTPDAEDFNSSDITIYDACVNFLEGVDDKGNETYSSAAGIPLGGPDVENSYCAKLAAATDLGAPRCKPQPATVVKMQLQ